MRIARCFWKRRAGSTTDVTGRRCIRQARKPTHTCRRNISATSAPRSHAMIRAMMTQELQASVLTAPLAQIDRRVLSQAWYSALNFARARESAAPAKKPVATNAAAQGRATPASVPNRRTSHAAPPASVAHPVSAKRGVSLDRGFERRAPRSPLARKIESVFLDPRSRVERSTFTVGSGRARVYVALQGKG